MAKMTYKNKRDHKKGMTLSYMKKTIQRQYADGQMGFAMSMYSSYKERGGKMTFRKITDPVRKVSAEHRNEFNDSYYRTYRKNYKNL